MATKKSAKKASKPTPVKSGKPAAKKAALASKKSAPAKKAAKPAPKKVAPAKKAVKPALKKSAPVKKAGKPAPKKAAPAKKAAKPAPKKAVPAKKAAKVATKKAAPAKKAAKVATKKAAPAKKTAKVATKKAAPAKKAAKVATKKIAPAKKAAKAAPVEKKVPAPVAKKEASAKKVVAPAPVVPPVPAPVPAKPAPVATPAPAAPAAVKPAPAPKAAPAPAPVPAKTEAPRPAIPLKPLLSDRPRSLLGVAALPPGGMPEWWRWHQDYPGEDTLRRGTVLTSFNLYTGLYTDTLRIHMAAGQSGIRAVSYSSKFSIDGDGSGGKQKGDTAFQDDTSLHHNDGNPPSKKNALNSVTFPYAVLPLPPKASNTLNFQSLGLDVGDIGIAFFGRGQAAPFIYGDEGPALQVGEGSIQMAKDLGMEWEGRMNTSPATGGFNENEMRTYAPGVLHIAFPGSRDRTDRITDIQTREELQAKAWDLFKRWKQSLRGGAV